MCYSLSDGGSRCDDYERFKDKDSRFFAPPPVEGVPNVIWIDDDHSEIWNDNKYSRDVACASLRRLSEVKKYEPKITSVALNAANDADGECAHLEHRVKSPLSLARKISDEVDTSILAGNPVAAMAVAQSLKDVVRYTVVHQEHDKLAETTKNVAASLKANGWEITGYKNFYATEDSPYKGIHLIGKTPSGIHSEVQVHSVDSLAVKNQNHVDYEIYRDSTKSPAQRKKAAAACKQRSRKLATPKDLDFLTLNNL